MKIGAYGKAWQATKLTPMADLNLNENIEKFKGRLVGNELSYEEATCDYIPGEYKMHNFDESYWSKMVSQVKAGAGSGTDGIGGIQIKQLWEKGSHQYRTEQICYWNNLINAKISKMEMENVSASKGIALQKDNGEVRPLVIKNEDQRITVKAVMTENQLEVALAKDKNQVLGEKMALQLVTGVNKCWDKVKDILNNKFIAMMDTINIKEFEDAIKNRDKYLMNIINDKNCLDELKNNLMIILMDFNIK